LEKARFREIKSEIRVLGIDDGPFKPRSKEQVLLVGTIFRGGQWLDGILSTHIEVDGTDATQKIADMVNRTRHKDQLRVIMTSGVTFAGFNVADISEIFKRTRLPVISVSRKCPDLDSVKRALQNLADWRERWEILKSAGKIYTVRIKRGEAPVHMQLAGIKRTDAEEIVRSITTRGLMPEPLRTAHLIARGVVSGESMGRA
jgi:endonuclease V-like protein UPF0215 family